MAEHTKARDKLLPSILYGGWYWLFRWGVSWVKGGGDFPWNFQGFPKFCEKRGIKKSGFFQMYLIPKKSETIQGDQEN